MRRRDVIQALCGLLGVSTLATPAACAPPHRDRSCSLVCTSPEPPTTTRRRLPTAYAPGSALRFGGSPRTATMRSPSRSSDRRDTSWATCPAGATRCPARLMDAGKRLSARTESIAQRGSWLNIQVSLYLDDA